VARWSHPVMSAQVDAEPLRTTFASIPGLVLHNDRTADFWLYSNAASPCDDAARGNRWQSYCPNVAYGQHSRS
jgi:hypothetical protein